MTATIASNSTLTKDQVERLLVQPLNQKSTFLSIPGIQQFVSNGEPIVLPALTSFGTAVAFTAEGTAIAEATAVTSEVTLLESSIYSVKSVAKMSNELLRSSRTTLNVEAAFSQALVGDVTRKLDSALWNGGTATTGSPVGVFNITGFTNAGTVAGTALASGDLYDAFEDYYLAYADEASAAWVMSPANWTRVRKMTDNYGARILQPALSLGAPSTLLGAPVVVTTHAPSTAIMLMDRSQVAVGVDTSRASLTILDQTWGDEDVTGIRVTARYDVKALAAKALVKLTIS